MLPKNAKLFSLVLKKILPEFVIIPYEFMIFWLFSELCKWLLSDKGRNTAINSLMPIIFKLWALILDNYLGQAVRL